MSAAAKERVQRRQEETRNNELIAKAAWEVIDRQSDRTVDDFVCDSTAAIQLARKLSKTFPGLTAYRMNKALLNARKRGQINTHQRQRRTKGE